MTPLIEVLPPKQNSTRLLAKLRNVQTFRGIREVGRHSLLCDRMSIGLIQLEHLGYLNLLQGMDMRALLSHPWREPGMPDTAGAFFLLGCEHQSGNGDYPHRVVKAVGVRLFRPKDPTFTLTAQQLSTLLASLLNEGFPDA